MRYFFGRQNPLRVFRNPEQVLWLFDFDGTLSPLVRRSESAVLPSITKHLLRELTRRFPGLTGVLSGRPLKTLRQKVGLSGLWYGGTHGFEIRGPHVHWAFPVSAARKKRLQQLATLWRPKLEGIPKLWMENKRVTLCTHFGEVRQRDWPATKRMLDRMSRQARRTGFKILHNINSLEILSSAHWNKGRAALWLKKRSRCTNMFYVGDDATDETVFRVLGPADVGVRIGRTSASRADWYVGSQSESTPLLRRILMR